MTIRHLKVFIKVTELGSISKAAEELMVAQPSVSQTIKELENYYNVSLFNRISRSLILTNDGEEILLKAKRVVEEFDNFEDFANQKEHSKVVKIGSTMAFGNKALPKIFKTIRTSIPGIDIKMHIDRPLDLEQMIIKGDLDFAFTERVPLSNQVKLDKIGEDKLIAVCKSDSNYPNRLKIKDLINYDLCVREEGSSSRIRLDEELRKQGIKLINPKLVSISNELILLAVLDNVGIGILPNFIAKDSIDKGLIKEIPLDINICRNLYLISLKDKKQTSMVKKAYKESLKVVENGPASLI